MRRFGLLILVLSLPACRTPSRPVTTPTPLTTRPSVASDLPLPIAKPSGTRFTRPTVVPPAPPETQEPGWQDAASLDRPRQNHSAVRLDDGRLLIAGGASDSVARGLLDSVRIYDPAADVWTKAASMSIPRYEFALIKLRDGRVLAAGGLSTRGITSTAELYDSATDSWSPTGSMGSARQVTAVTMLKDGTVLAVGGSDAKGITSYTETYDPATGVWTERAPLPEPRLGQTQLQLADGRVLVAGGVTLNVQVLASSVLYDPLTGRWRRTGAMSTPRFGTKGLLLPDGRVLTAGGSSGGDAIASTEIYDPASGTWSGASPLRQARATPSAVLINGRAVFAGGIASHAGVDSVESYDYDAGAWTRLPSMADARGLFTLSELADGRFLAVGGERNGSALSSTEFFSMRGTLSVRRSPSRPPRSAAIAPPAAPFVSRRTQRSDDYAVVIGIERYRSLPSAAYAENDAAAVATAMLSLGVPEENVVRLQGGRAGLTEIAKYIEEWLPRRAKKTSRVFVFFSGHGAPDVASGTPYLMPWDGDATFVKSTGYSLERLYASLDKLIADDVIVALDSCFSGSGGRSVLAPGLRPLVNVRLATAPRRLSVLTASEATEAAGGLPGAGHGAFTYHLLQGLGGSADADADGHLTLAELHAYTRKRVILDAREQNREQTPTLSTRAPGLRLY